MKAVTIMDSREFKDAVKNHGPCQYDLYDHPSGSYTHRWANRFNEVLEHKYCAHDNEHTFTLTCTLAGWPVTAKTHEELECECFVCGTKELRWFSKELIADPDDREHVKRGSLCSYCTDEEVVEDEEEESFPEEK